MPIRAVFKGIHAQLWIQSSFWSQAEGCLLFDHSRDYVVWMVWEWEGLRMLRLSPTGYGLAFAFLKLCNCLNLNYSQGSSQECWQTWCRAPCASPDFVLSLIFPRAVSETL